MLAVVLAATLDLAVARSAFEDLDRLCRADAGRLWGVSLCGPVVVADPRSRDAVTWIDGELKTAKIPESVGIANYGADWDGRRWTMVMWPLPEEPFSRRSLLAHESWHRVQEAIGFKPTGPKNDHLDETDGRYWLRLELRALARALESGAKSAVEDALAFRARRSAAAEQERLLEMHEGLAEYTGTAIAEPRVRERAPLVAKLVRAGDANDHFVRSFAYVTGPAWGALIEMRSPRWTRSVKPSDDLPRLAMRAWKATVPENAEARAVKYGAAELRVAEELRTERKRAERAALRAKFVDGPTLTLPIDQGSSFTFDPYGVQALDGIGSVYRSLKLRAAWGTLEATGGALIASDWKNVIVPGSGEGYTLTLNEGWTKVRGTVAKP